MPGFCSRCLREVYFAEEKLALGKVWHTFCFSCRNCRKLLDSWTVETHSGELFCRNCYNRLYSTTSVRPSLPVPLSPIYLAAVDKKDLAVTSCESLSDGCCCCCCREEKFTIINPANENSRLIVETANCPSEKGRLRGGASHTEKEDSPEAGESSEVGGATEEACAREGAISELDLRSSPINICEQPGSPTAITEWYSNRHSASQSIVDNSSSINQNCLRPSSTPASDVNICNNCSSNWLDKKKPGSPCRKSHRNCEHCKQCHRRHCREFQRAGRIPCSQEGDTLKECWGKNFVENYRKQLRVYDLGNAAIIDPPRRKHSYPPLPPHYSPPVSRKKVSFRSPENFPPGGAIARFSAMQSDNAEKKSSPVDVISFEHSSGRDIDEVYDKTEDAGEEDSRMRGGCGGGGGASGCGCSSGGRGRISGVVDHSHESFCGRGYKNETSSPIEGACGCNSRGKDAFGGNGYTPGGCCNRFEGTPRTGGCCGTNGDDVDGGACASKSSTGYRPTGYEICPPRSPDRCNPSSQPSCGAAACSPPCSDRKGCCPAADSRPVRRNVTRCNTPCTGDSQNCGGGGCCGGGCRGGCGKPGQTCLPLRSCSNPPCQTHSQGGRSPCMPPRGCSPQPPCSRIPNAPGMSNKSGAADGCGGSSCCRPRSSGYRSVGGGGCSPPTGCQHQDDQVKPPSGCECLGGGQDCQRCGRKVYQAEMQMVSGSHYHNICFSCFCCRKPLETLTYHENCGEIYCKQCYIRNFGPQGYGYSGVLQTPM